MSRKKLALLVTLGISCAISILAFVTSGKPTQIVEADGYRTVEYHLFGVIPFPTQVISEPNLRVSEDVRQHIRSCLSLPPGTDLPRARELTRIKRHSGTQYWAYVPFNGNLATAIALIQSQLTDARTFNPPGMAMIEGRSHAGERVSVYATGSGTQREFSVSVTDPKPAY